jgi:hypothetical protein
MRSSFSGAAQNKKQSEENRVSPTASRSSREKGEETQVQPKSETKKKSKLVHNENIFLK